MTASTAPFLSKDAFLVPTYEKKDEEKKPDEYKKLYGDAVAHKIYIKEPARPEERPNESPEK